VALDDLRGVPGCGGDPGKLSAAGGATVPRRAGGWPRRRAGRRRTRPTIEVLDALHAVAGERAVPPARVALAWVLGRPGVSATVVGATRPSQVDDAVAAVDLELGVEEVAALEAGYRPHAPFGHS
jgi:1-deoxyxylulose-5-phosphate synthase